MQENDRPIAEPPDGKYAGFVPVFLARSADEAECYQDLLNDHDVPAITGSLETIDNGSHQTLRRTGMTRGVPVLVPESLLDEASEIIADRENVGELADEDDLEEEDDEFSLPDEGSSAPMLPLEDTEGDEDDIFIDDDSDDEDSEDGV